jgi:acyl-ACP thioesterase
VRADARSLAEFVQPPPGGRQFSQERRPLLGDCGPGGRIRLDALAGMLQDIAYMDVDDAGVAELAVWVLRRSRMCVKRFPRFGDRLSLTTFCSGIGKMWAERRTTVIAEGDTESCVEAVSLWVHLDPVSWRPVPLSRAEIDAYGDAAAGRRVTARLRHPAPGPDQRHPAPGPDQRHPAPGPDQRHPARPPDEQRGRWRFREIDCDIAGHINNAVYWQPLEEELLAGEVPEPSSLDVEIEFRTPAQPGEMVVLRNGAARWIVNLDGETHASIVVDGMS